LGKRILIRIVVNSRLSTKGEYRITHLGPEYGIYPIQIRITKGFTIGERIDEFLLDIGSNTWAPFNSYLGSNKRSSKGSDGGLDWTGPVKGSHFPPIGKTPPGEIRDSREIRGHRGD